MLMNRRAFSKLAATVLATFTVNQLAGKSISIMSSKMNQHYLGSTGLIQASHPRIVALANAITLKAKHRKDAAILIHDWVRDEIKFGISSRFYDTSATQVLGEKVGYCNTKVSLFNALLRAKAIPTRIRMMDLSAMVLNGLFDPGTAYVDHAITEVFLGQEWIKVDSYIVDKALADSARKKLTQANMKAGFGIHIDGKTDWDGKSDNFSQCLDNASIENYVLKDHGIFVDVADFYKNSEAARNRQSFASKMMIRFGAGGINKKIQAVRES